ncbi:LysR family transcriptional regulator [Ferrovibrio sp.]|uniref:LysR family transcriptional regulator n=1 Tax=Ferrovibrio sp. TaxID=1917215 RepID=UPI0026219D8C|nr:LysR family transcriptional regulator [Ferrovibrio sp.]
MDLDSLVIFIEVLRRGSFVAVARDRNVAPSSISRAISALEEQLGSRLLQRTTRRVAPTEAGMAYFERIEPVVEEMLRANQSLAEDAGQPRGSLRITTSVSFGHEKIVPLLPGFAARYPSLKLDVLLSDNVIDLVAERIDVAIRLGQLPDSRLVAHRLIATRYRVCASPAYLERHGLPRLPRELAGHNCILFPLPGFRSRWVFRNRKGELVRVPVAGNAMLSSASSIHRCAMAGMGVALLPDWLVAADIAAGRLTDLFPRLDVTATDFDTAVWAVYPSRAYMPQKTRVFIDYVKATLAA